MVSEANPRSSQHHKLKQYAGLPVLDRGLDERESITPARGSHLWGSQERMKRGARDKEVAKRLIAGRAVHCTGLSSSRSERTHCVLRGPPWREVSWQQHRGLGRHTSERLRSRGTGEKLGRMTKA